MKKRDAEQCLKNALEKTAPQDAAGVLARCGGQGSGQIVLLPRRRNVRRFAALAAACVALIAAVGGLIYRETTEVTSVVSLDVNPSIELSVDRRERVVSCEARNDKARDVLRDMDGGDDLAGAKLSVAVNAIVGGLLRSGYLNELSSAIMISVEDRDGTRAEKLRTELTDAVDGLLRTSGAQAAVLTQTVQKDKTLDGLAKENGISSGKAALIERIRQKNPALAFGELAALPVSDLKDLLKADAPAMPIGAARAAEIAKAEFAKLGIGAAVECETDAELDEDPAHYEVELTNAQGTEAEYRIDAYSGKILSFVIDRDDDPVPPAQTTVPAGAGTTKPAAARDIGYAAAKAAALKHAGLTESGIRELDMELDREDGVPVYEIEFKAGGYEYEYTIDAATGKILAQERELDD